MDSWCVVGSWGPSWGEVFRSTNGILQGCPLSVIMINLFSQTWVNLIKAEAPRVRPKAYADDLAMTAEDIGHLDHATAITGEFADNTGMRANTIKSNAWATHRPARDQLSILRVHGEALPIVQGSGTLGPTSAFQGKERPPR